LTEEVATTAPTIPRIVVRMLACLTTYPLGLRLKAKVLASSAPSC
jgi:hypothetical protein